jgi:DNA-binding transcriptional LysR family regulator
VKSLERELGVELFERIGRNIRLTQPGELFHDYAVRILSLVDEARQAVSETASGAKGRVVVGAGATTTIFTLPPVLHRLRAEHPGIEVIIRSGASREVTKMVLSGEVDLGLVTSPVDENDLVVTPLLEEKVVAIVGRDHPLAKQGKATISEFAHEPLILYVRGSGFRTYLDAIFASAGIDPQVQMELDNIEAIKALVEIGVGASLVPEAAVPLDTRDGRLSIIEISDLPHLSRCLSLVYRRDKYLSPGIKLFLSAVEALQAYGQCSLQLE